MNNHCSGASNGLGVLPGKLRLQREAQEFFG
jgi:hypothetical protein